MSSLCHAKVANCMPRYNLYQRSQRRVKEGKRGGRGGEVYSAPMVSRRAAHLHIQPTKRGVSSKVGWHVWFVSSRDSALCVNCLSLFVLGNDVRDSYVLCNNNRH